MAKQRKKRKAAVVYKKIKAKVFKEIKDKLSVGGSIDAIEIKKRYKLTDSTAYLYVKTATNEFEKKNKNKFEENAIMTGKNLKNDEKLQEKPPILKFNDIMEKLSTIEKSFKDIIEIDKSNNEIDGKQFKEAQTSQGKILDSIKDMSDDIDLIKDRIPEDFCTRFPQICKLAEMKSNIETKSTDQEKGLIEKEHKHHPSLQETLDCPECGGAIRGIAPQLITKENAQDILDRLKEMGYINKPKEIEAGNEETTKLKEQTTVEKGKVDEGNDIGTEQTNDDPGGSEETNGTTGKGKKFNSLDF